MTQYKIDQPLLHRAVNTFGHYAQLRKAAEEHIELAHALLRFIEAAENGVPLETLNQRRNDVIEEFGDSELMRAQLVDMAVVTPSEVQAVIDEKSKRLTVNLDRHAPALSRLLLRELLQQFWCFKCEANHNALNTCGRGGVVGVPR